MSENNMPEHHSKKQFEFSPSVSILLAGVIVAGAILLVHVLPAAAPSIAATTGTTAQNTQPSVQDQMSPTLYAQLAQALGVDMTKYNTCVTAKTYQSKIDAQEAEAMKAGGEGTPFTMIVDTKTNKEVPVSGALPYDQIKAAMASVDTQGTALNITPPSANDHIIGSPTAPIVLVEYSDFQCPYCKLIYPTLKQIVSESNGQVAWVYREFPLYQIHPEAENAANAAECISAQKGNDAFWKFADTIFEG